jgi:hypothetical protein
VKQVAEDRSALPYHNRNSPAFARLFSLKVDHSLDALLKIIDFVISYSTIVLILFVGNK